MWSAPRIPGPPPSRLFPAGAVLTLDDSARWLGEAHLAGGSPFRLLRLTPAGADQVRRWTDGEPLAESEGARLLARRLVDAGLAHPRWPSGDGSRSITVVIPVRDRPQEIGELLPLLVGLEVLVVDDGSADPDALAEVIEGTGARLIRRDVAGGPGAARNTGLAEVTTPLTCFLDSDCRPSAGFLDLLVSHLSDESVALVAPRIVGAPALGLLGRFEMTCSPLDVGGAPARVRPGGIVTFVPSACMVVRTVLGPDLFNEDLLGGEDVDLVWRLAEAGWSIRLEPAVEVEHPARSTLISWLAQRYFYGSTATDLAQLHGDAAAPIGGSAFSVGAVGSTALGFPLTAAGILSIGIGILARRLDQVVEDPLSTSVTLMTRSAVEAAPTLARQTVRSFAPLLAIGSILSRRVRRATLAAVILGQLGRWWGSGSNLDPVRFGAIGLADDLAYGAGLWSGALRKRRAGALRPRLVLFARSGDEGAEGADAD